MYIYIYIYTHTHTLYIHIYIHTINKYINTYIYIYIYIHHIYIYIQTIYIYIYIVLIYCLLDTACFTYTKDDFIRISIVFYIRLTAPNITVRRLCEAGLHGRIAVKKPQLRKQNNVKSLQWVKVKRLDNRAVE